MSELYDTMLWERFTPYRCTARTFEAWFTLFNRYQCEGVGHLPKNGPFIVASNHMSFADPPLIAAGIPERYNVHYMARKTLFKGPFGKFIAAINAFPVDRDGVSDLSAFRTVFNILKQGDVLVLFIEGTRSSDGNLQSPRNGVGLIACRAAVPVVPARIFGSFQLWGRNQKMPNWFQPVQVRFGKPILPSEFDPGRSDPDRNQTAAERIFDRIRLLNLDASS